MLVLVDSFTQDIHFINFVGVEKSTMDRIDRMIEWLSYLSTNFSNNIY